MPNLTPDTGIRDNDTRGTVASFLTEKIQDGSTLSIVSAYFTIYAHDALKHNLDRIEHLDFLFGEPSFVNRLDSSKTEKKAFIMDSAGLELASKLQQKRVSFQDYSLLGDLVANYDSWTLRLDRRTTREANEQIPETTS